MWFSEGDIIVTLDADGATNPEEPKITVLICTLNEEESLPHVLPKIPTWIDEVLLVDGHSTDNTVEKARKLRPGIKVLYQPGKGKGNALTHGFIHASGDIVVTLDADGSTDPQKIPMFIKPLLEGYDFVKGSRFLGVKPLDMPWQRRLGNKFFALLTNLLYGTSYTDVTCGYNSFWKKSFEKIGFSDKDFLDEPTINIRIKKARLKIIEIPYIDEGRIAGVGKDHALQQGLRILKNILRELF